MKEETRKLLQLLFMVILAGVVAGGILNTMKQHGIEVKVPTMIV